MFDIRRFLIVFITAGLAKNLPLYGTYPPVKDLLMHLTGTVKDEETGKLLYKGTLDEVFESAYNKSYEAIKWKKLPEEDEQDAPSYEVIGWKLLGEDATERTMIEKPSSFKYGIKKIGTVPATDVYRMLCLEVEDLGVNKIYAVLLSEDFARGLLTDEVVDAFYGLSGSRCSVSVRDKEVENDNLGILRNFYVTYFQSCGSVGIDVNFKVTCDTESGKIKKGSVYVTHMEITDFDENTGTQIGYCSSNRMGHHDLLDELRRIIDKEEEAVLRKNPKGTLKRMELCLRTTAQEKSSFGSEESLKDTFSKYPTPEVLMRELNCSNKDLDNGFTYVSYYLRELEASKDEKSRYAKNKILFELQGEKVSVNEKGIPDIPEKIIPSVERKYEFRQVCKVLLSVDFAKVLLGDSFIRSFLEKDKKYKSSISVSFRELVGGENVFEFYVTYCQKNAQSCRVRIEFNVYYDADEGRFKRDEKGSKVRITCFSIGKFEILPLNSKEVLRNDDLKYLEAYLSQRLNTIRNVLFCSKKNLFVSILDNLLRLKGGWVGIRRSVAMVFPYRVRSVGRCDYYEDHEPCDNCSCRCKSPRDIFDFMYNNEHLIDVKDWVTGGKVVLCKNGGRTWWKDEIYELGQNWTRCSGVTINLEKGLISRESLMKLKGWEGKGFQEEDWPLLPSSVFMVGEVQSDKESKKDCQKDVKDRPKGGGLEKFSGNNTIQEVEPEKEVDPEEKEKNV